MRAALPGRVRLSYGRRVVVVSTLSLASIAAVVTAVAVLAPDLRARFGLGLGHTGFLVAATEAGVAAAVLASGEAADRFGERRVLILGLAGAGLAAGAAAVASTYAAFLLALVAVGACSATVVTAGPRIVLGAISHRRHTTALAVRQSAIPISGAAVALAIGHVAAVGGTDLAFAMLAASFLLAAALATAWLGPDDRVPWAPAVPRGRHPLRDAAVWRVCLAGAILLGGQSVLVAFLPLYLVDVHGVRQTAASALLAAMLLGGGALLFALSRRSDRTQVRIGPLRGVACSVVAGFVVLCLTDALPWPFVAAAMVATGAVALSWVPLLTAAVAALVPRARHGAAFGIQQTVAALAAALGPIGFAWCADTWSWRTAFAIAAVALTAVPALLLGSTDQQPS